MGLTHRKCLRLAFLKVLPDLRVLRVLLVLLDRLDLPEPMVQMVALARQGLLDRLVPLDLPEVMVLLPDLEHLPHQQDQ